MRLIHAHACNKGMIMPTTFLRPILIAVALITAGVAGAQAQMANGLEFSFGSFHKRVCNNLPEAGAARCHVEVVTDARGVPLQRSIPGIAPLTATTTGAVPYYAPDLWSAYYGTTTLPAPPTGTVAPTTTPTVAVVAAYSYGRVRTDLTQYRAVNNLPPLCSSTVTSNCVRFTRLNQSGVAGSYPIGNAGWAQEQALDVQMVSALCPWCNIVLVEAKSASYANLAAAEVTAGNQPGVIAISNSYGGPETNSSLYAGSFSPSNTVTNGSAGKLNPAIAVVVSSGDDGNARGAEFPSSTPYVISAGGTRLVYSGGQWSETAWTKAGSGCSTVYSQMSWQSAVLPYNACAGRVTSDVSAVADPGTGVAVVYNGKLYRFGGTSVSAPLIAGIIGQHNQPTPLTLNSDGTVATGPAKKLYAARAALRDVTSGSNGTCGTYVCNAAAGYDGPTGLGTINGDLSPF
jgi:hypothetical protein